jgi:pilus assembly protein Flp/PilA
MQRVSAGDDLARKETAAMKSLLGKIVRFAASEGGPTAVEYAVLLMVVFLACLSMITLLGQSTATSFQDSSSHLHQSLQGGP